MKVRLFLLILISMLVYVTQSFATFVQINGNFEEYGLSLEYEGYYVIENSTDLETFRNLVNSNEAMCSANVVLLADIVLNERVLDTNGDLRNDYEVVGLQEWISISQFSGVFDGNGHSVSGIYMNSSNSSGFFSTLLNATVKNLTLLDCFISGFDNVGVLAGQAYESIIDGCCVAGRVQGNRNVGGLIGALGSSSKELLNTIKNSINYAKVSATNNVGGLFGNGYETNISISQCVNYGDVYGEFAGGLFGSVSAYNRETYHVIIEDSENKGAIQSVSYAGGILGLIENISVSVKRCLNGGKIDNNFVSGGIVGRGGDILIEECYNSGDISTKEKAAGIIGCSDSNVVLKNNINSGTIWGENQVCGIGELSNNCSMLSCINVGPVHAESMFAPLSWSSLDDSQTIDNNYYDSNVSWVSDEYGTGISTENLCSGFLMNLDESIWVKGNSLIESSINSDDTVFGYTINGRYPRLMWMHEHPIAKNLLYNFGNNQPDWETYIPIYTLSELNRVKENTSANYVVMQDIHDIGAWVPIQEFTGKFSGNNKCLSGFVMDYPDMDSVGIFKLIAPTSLVMNVVLKQGLIQGRENVGGICGASMGIIRNCKNYATINGYQFVGGICGRMEGEEIIGCYNEGSISASSWAAGICGYGGSFNSLVKNCCNKGTISGAGGNGGICGAGPMRIESCYNMGLINSTGYHNGGIVGWAIGYPVRFCINVGEVEGVANLGAIAGEGTVEYCYYDSERCTVKGSNNIDLLGYVEGRKTKELCNGTMPNDLFSSDWAIMPFEVKDLKKYMYYPYLKVFGEESAELGAVLPCSPVFFNFNEGSTTDSIITYYVEGETASLPANVTKKGCRFNGWYDNSNYTSSKYTEIPVSSVGSRTFYAQWLVNSYDVNLIPNGGYINSGNVISYTFGYGATLPVDVTKVGYDFAGWYEEEDCSGERVYSIAMDDVGNRIFYAKWVTKNYTVTLHTSGGNILDEKVTEYSYGVAVPLPKNLKLEGYTFKGWYSNSYFDGLPVTEIEAGSLGDKQFWARWIINKYEVSVISENGVVEGSGIFEYKSTVTLKAVAYEGYEFVNWSNGSTESKTQFIVTKDTTVTANFKEKEKVLAVDKLIIPILKTSREVAPIDLSKLFHSTEGGDLIFTATSSTPNVVSAAISEQKLFLTVYEYEGESEITVTATLANGEKKSLQAKATVEFACNIVVSETITNVSCYGESDGQIALYIANASEPYSIQWIGLEESNDTLFSIKAGNYIASIEDAEGCMYQKMYSVLQPQEIVVNTIITNPTCGNADGSIITGISGGTNFTYIWNNDTTTRSLINIASGEYNLVVINNETGCKVETSVVLTEPDAPVVKISDVIETACNENNGAVIISGADNLIYKWSNSRATKNLTDVYAGDYTLEVVNPETNCKASLAVTVPSIALKQPEISLVTVSQETGKNLVVWLKENTDLIDYYTIYRETEGKDIYEMVDRVPYSELSVYEDLEADPNVRAWRYKMTATDVCGTETEMSAHHKTIHLRKNMGMNNTYNLEWDEYEGLDFSSFVIYREYKVGTVFMLDTIATLPSNVTAITDLEPVKRTTGYYIGIVLSEEINPKTQFMKVESGPFVMAISNIAEVENDDENPTIVENLENQVVVYAVGHTIYVKNAEGDDITIYDNNGRTIANVADENEIFVRLDGTYFVKVGNESFAVVIK